MTRYLLAIATLLHITTAKTSYCYQSSIAENGWTYCTKMGFGLGKIAEIKTLISSDLDSTPESLEILVLTEKEWTKVHEIKKDKVTC